MYHLNLAWKPCVTFRLIFIRHKMSKTCWVIYWLGLRIIQNAKRNSAETMPDLNKHQTAKIISTYTKNIFRIFEVFLFLSKFQWKYYLMLYGLSNLMNIFQESNVWWIWKILAHALDLNLSFCDITRKRWIIYVIDPSISCTRLRKMAKNVHGRRIIFQTWWKAWPV